MRQHRAINIRQFHGTCTESIIGKEPKRRQAYVQNVYKITLYSGLRLIWPPRARQKVATITGGLYYPEFIFSKKSKFLYKSGYINRLDILSVDILSGVYCTAVKTSVNRARHVGPINQWIYEALLNKMF